MERLLEDENIYAKQATIHMENILPANTEIFAYLESSSYEATAHTIAINTIHPTAHSIFSVVDFINAPSLFAERQGSD